MTQDNGRNATLMRQPRFHQLIRVGLPNRLRGEMWELTSGSLFLRLHDPNLYHNTLAKFKGKESLAIDEIEKDLNRSLPEYAGYQSHEGIERLRRVLTAYSWTNEEVGYCQAMNIVIAAILMYYDTFLFKRCFLTRASYTSEAQAFSLLSVLCDRLLPGYYSITMYGTLLDQKVFESLTCQKMPILWDHLVKSDVQLSVVSLPWFLSLYINSMPLIYAFRVLDVFFLEGPKVLFQVGLAILRINGEQLLDVTDDGAFISLLKDYFSKLDESAHPTSENEKLRSVTKFQELMVVAFKEFAQVTQSSISEQRARHKDAVLDGIETFAKRTSIRNLGPDSKRFDPNDLGFVYDRFYYVLYEQERMATESLKHGRSKMNDILSRDVERGRVGIGKSPERMNYDGFREFLSGITRWAGADSPRTPDRSLEWSPNKTPSRHRESIYQRDSKAADHDFMQRLYGNWNRDDHDGLSLQDVVSGLAKVKGTRDLMTSISYFYELYDDSRDGKVDREGILRISEALLFLTRRGLEGDVGANGGEAISSIGSRDRASLGEKFLSSVSAFIRRCFEYADPDHPQNQDDDSTKVSEDKFSVGEDDDEDLVDLSDTTPTASKPDPLASKEMSSPMSIEIQSPQSANAALDPAKPLHITLPTFRMVVLADELLQQFFEFSFAESFHLSPTSLSESTSTSSFQTPTLTTFSNVGRRSFSSSQTSNISGSIPPNKGLRGVLDNIVTDGMRVAAEVRKRMDEAQREMERNALGRDEEYDDDDEDNKDRRSVKDGDRDLLDGAEVGSVKDGEQGMLGEVDLLGGEPLPKKSVEFESQL